MDLNTLLAELDTRTAQFRAYPETKGSTCITERAAAAIRLLVQENEQLQARQLGISLVEYRRRKQLDAQAARILAVRARRERCPDCASGLKHQHSDSE